MLRGEAHLVFRDITTGEITREHRQKNTITETMLNRMAGCDLNFNGGYGRFGDYVFIGGWQQPTDRDTYRIWDVFAFGYTETGVTQPRFLSGNVGTGGTFAYYYEYQQRFNPPSSDRDIYVVAVPWDGTTSPRGGNEPTDAAAYLALTTPCTQTTTETLDVFYRIIWDNPDPVASGMNNSRMLQLARRHAGANYSEATYYPNYNIFYYHLTKALPFMDGEYVGDSYCGIGSGGLGSYFGSTTYAGGSAYADTSYRSRVMTFSCSLTQLTGRIVGGVGHLRNQYAPNSRALFYNPLLRPSDSPIQNIFGHSAAGTGPFYRSTEVPAGGATVDVNGDSWTNPDWNKLLHIEITGSGNTGTATYKTHISNITGFKNNTYYPAIVGILSCHSANNFGGHTWFEDGSTYYSDYNGLLAMEHGTNPTQMVVFKYDVIGRMDVITNERHRFTGTTTPAYDGTSLHQVYVVHDRSNVGSCVPDDMWVADAAGLYRIYADNSTIDKFDTTHPDLSGLSSNACYGVTYTPGRIWAAFDGGLAWTDDNGATFTVYDSGSTPAFNIADYSRIWFIQGDPSHADHRLAIAYNTEGTPNNRADLDIYWWDSVSGNGNTLTNVYYGGTGNDPRLRCETFRLFSCSPNDSVWGCRAYNAQSQQVTMFAYNATTHTHTYATHGSPNNKNRYFLNWTRDLNGDDAMHVVYWSNDDTRFAICKQDGTRVLSDRMYRSDLPLGTMSGWYADGSGSQSQKCILSSGMLVGSTLRNNSWGEIRAWYMIPAWNDQDAPLGGEGYHILWKGYGWDGANWVEGNTNSKTTHAGHEALIDGLTVAFDDDGAAETFVATDHYTCGVIDGILVDAATEFNHSYSMYYKPVQFDRTEVEGAGLLPATTQKADYYVPSGSREVYIDPNNMSAANTDNVLGGSQEWGTRLNFPMTDFARFRWRVDTGSGFGAGNHINAGLCNTTKIGTTVTGDNIDYSFRISAGVVNGDNFRIEVINNGTVVHTIHDGSYSSIGDTSHSPHWRNNEDYVTMELRRDEGSTDLNLLWRDKVVYTFSGVTETLMPAVRSVGYPGQFHYARLDTIGYSIDDYMIELGDSGSSTGYFDPNFWAIDYTVPGRPGSIKINGVEATTVYVNDYTTPLAAGEVDVLAHRGRIRFSPSDVGKTLTIDRYNVILHEY